MVYPRWDVGCVCFHHVPCGFVPGVFALDIDLALRSTHNKRSHNGLKMHLIIDRNGLPTPTILLIQHNKSRSLLQHLINSLMYAQLIKPNGRLRRHSSQIRISLPKSPKKVRIHQQHLGAIGKHVTLIFLLLCDKFQF